MAPRQTREHQQYSGTAQWEQGHFWLNPAKQGVVDLMADLTAEMCEKFEPRGLIMGGLQYPAPNFGYDVETIKQYGMSPLENLGAWNNWRQQRITELLLAIRERSNAAYKRPELIAQAYGMESHGRDHLLQDPYRWLAQGAVDAVTLSKISWDNPDPVVYDDVIRKLKDHAHRIDIIDLQHLPEPSPNLYFPEVIRIGDYINQHFEWGQSHVFIGGTTDLGDHWIEIFQGWRNTYMHLAKKDGGQILSINPEKSAELPRALITQFESGSPVYPSGQEFRVGGLVVGEPPLPTTATLTIKQPNPITIGFGDENTTKTHIWRGLLEVETVNMAALNYTTTATSMIYVSDPAEGLDITKTRDDEVKLNYHLQMSMDDRATTDPAKAAEAKTIRSAPLRVRPVATPSVLACKGTFGPAVENAQYPCIVDGRALWVSSAGQNAVFAFDRQGSPLRFSPMRDGKHPNGRLIPIKNPRSIQQAPSGDVLVLSEYNDAPILLRFRQNGERLPGIRFEIPEDVAWPGAKTRDGKPILDLEAFDIGPDGLIYAAGAGWHVFAPDGKWLASPVPPAWLEAPTGQPTRRTSDEFGPGIFAGISVSRDGKSVYVTKPSERQVLEFTFTDLTDSVSTDIITSKTLLFYMQEEDEFCETSEYTHSVEVFDDGRVFVADGDHFVRIYSPEGEHLGDCWSDLPPLRRPRGIAILPTGKSFFVAANGYKADQGRLLLFVPQSTLKTPPRNSPITPPGPTHRDDTPSTDTVTPDSVSTDTVSTSSVGTN
jgi:hypothetical protein